MKEARLIGVRATIFEKDELLDRIGRAVRENEHVKILSGNVHGYNLAYEIPWLHQMFEEATAIRIDGEGVRLGLKLLGYQVPKRMTWAEFVWDLAEYASEHDCSLFLLGSRDGRAKISGEKLRKMQPSLKIAGTRHGYFDMGKSSVDNSEVINDINRSNADILIVGFGMPRQEKWVNENFEALKCNVVLTGGGVFDYLSGEKTRPPELLTKNGLEWLGRLVLEPRRLWKRYLIGNPLFLIRAVRSRWANDLNH